MRIMLDTNVCIALMRGHAKVVSRKSTCAHGDRAISIVTLYEILFGVAKYAEPERERAKMRRLLSAVRVAAFDEAAAEQAAEVRVKLQKVGKVCGPYDILLAGHALSLGLPLATNNVRGFSRVGGLLVEDWMS